MPKPTKLRQPKPIVGATSGSAYTTHSTPPSSGGDDTGAGWKVGDTPGMPEPADGTTDIRPIPPPALPASMQQAATSMRQPTPLGGGQPQFDYQSQAMAGWDQGKWSNPEHQTMKYQVGRILSMFPPTPEGLRQALPLIQQFAPNATIDGLDKLVGLGGETLGPIDALVGAQQGGKSWGWQDLGEADMSGSFGMPSGPVQIGGGQSFGFSGGGGSMPASGPPVPGWLRTPTGEWVPPDHPLAATASAVTAPGQPGSGVGGGTGGGTSTTRPTMDVRQTIADILARGEGGGLNEDVITRRVGGARADLERFKNSQIDSLSAELADRGLIGSGGETEALSGLAERLQSQLGSDVSQIYADESARADDRFIQALSLGTGMTIEEAQNAIDWFNAETGRTGTEGNLQLGAGDLALRGELGRGELALGNRRAGIDEMLGLGQLGLGQDTLASNYMLGQGRLGLDRELGMYGIQNQQSSQFMQMIQAILEAAGLSGRGYE